SQLIIHYKYAINDLGSEENYPGIFQKDFFDIHPDLVEFTQPKKVIIKGLGKEPVELELPRNFDCVAGNPPYTRQEELEDIVEIEGYKERITETVTHYRNKKIASLGKRAGIYAHFFLHGWKFLKEGGRFGFIVASSWLNVDYGKYLEEFFLKNYKIIAIIESKVERWFEDADINTCIVILEKCFDKKVRDENIVQFVYFKKPLNYFIPISESMWEKEVERLNEIDKLKKLILGHYSFYDSEDIRIFPKEQRELWEEGFDKNSLNYLGSRWGKYIRAPKIYFKVLKKRKNLFIRLK
ncbi:unnamed protein product, partial [marine sediment metagenome]